MTLYDANIDRTLTLTDLHREWQQFKAEEPWNHADDFTTELYEILMATINGRNDCDIIGMTPSETSNYIITIRDTLRRRN